MNYVNRKVDELGRIVLPLAYRKRLGIDAGDSVVIEENGDKLIITTETRRCKICGTPVDGEICVCRNCLDELKKM